MGRSIVGSWKKRKHVITKASTSTRINPRPVKVTQMEKSPTGDWILPPLREQDACPSTAKE